MHLNGKVTLYIIHDYNHNGQIDQGVAKLTNNIDNDPIGRYRALVDNIHNKFIDDNSFGIPDVVLLAIKTAYIDMDMAKQVSFVSHYGGNMEVNTRINPTEPLVDYTKPTTSKGGHDRPYVTIGGRRYRECDKVQVASVTYYRITAIRHGKVSYTVVQVHDSHSNDVVNRVYTSDAVRFIEDCEYHRNNNNIS